MNTAEKKMRILSVFTEHAFDFFSMFLAIILGFFVDNYRDDMQSKDTAKDLSVDLIADLCRDTSAIRDMLLHSDNKERILTELYSLVSDDASNVPDSLIYLYTAHLTRRPWFDRHNSSYQLCINTGYLQYFNKDIVNRLTEYDIDCNKTISLLITEKDLMRSKIFPFLQNIFHTENFTSLLENGRLTEPPLLYNWNAENRWLYHNYVFELIELNRDIIRHYNNLLNKSRAALMVLNSGDI